MRLRYSKKACAALMAFLILAIPTVACSQKGAVQGQTSSDAQSGNGSSSRTIIVGEVTAVVGNQVTLAVGSLGRSGSSTGSDSSTAASSSTSSSSSLITLTGETKTFLIPVGLTLSNGFSAGSRTSSQRSGSSGSDSGGSGGGIPQGGSGQTGSGFGGGTASRSGTATRTSGSGDTSGATGLTQQRSSDFSSITTGMVLQIAEETLDDGTEGIVSVSVLSR